MLFHIVDDLPELRDILSSLIASKGHDTKQFDSAESYLKYFNSAAFIAPVAILSDYMMTGKTGLQLIKAVREKSPYQKAVIVSGTPCSELDASIEAYLCYSLNKPYHMQELFDLLDVLIQCEQSCQRQTGRHTDFCHTDCSHGLDHPCPFHSGDSK
ncbi:MAG: response regulator [Mariprofundus sp.]|nr:response regulator [Mariprofundus sp.]